MDKLTEWYPPEIKPVRAGAYEVEMLPELHWFRWFNGSDWARSYWSTPELTGEQKNADWQCAVQTYPWRGLASDPAKGANHD